MPMPDTISDLALAIFRLRNPRSRRTSRFAALVKTADGKCWHCPGCGATSPEDRTWRFGANGQYHWADDHERHCAPAYVAKATYQERWQAARKYRAIVRGNTLYRQELADQVIAWLQEAAAFAEQGDVESADRCAEIALVK